MEVAYRKFVTSRTLAPKSHKVNGGFMQTGFQSPPPSAILLGFFEARSLLNRSRSAHFCHAWPTRATIPPSHPAHPLVARNFYLSMLLFDEHKDLPRCRLPFQFFYDDIRIKFNFSFQRHEFRWKVSALKERNERRILRWNNVYSIVSIRQNEKNRPFHGRSMDKFYGVIGSGAGISCISIVQDLCERFAEYSGHGLNIHTRVFVARFARCTFSSCGTSQPPFSLSLTSNKKGVVSSCFSV